MIVLLWGDKNYSYVVYSNAGNIRVTDSELYDSAMGGVMSAYGGRLEITNCKGSGFKYGHMAHSSGLTGGAGYGLKGDTANTFEWEGGLVKGSHGIINLENSHHNLIFHQHHQHQKQFKEQKLGQVMLLILRMLKC